MAVRSTPFRRVLEFYNDREYFERLLRIGVPVALQSLLTSSLNMIGVVIIGQLGDVAVASVGLANQVFFLLNLVLFGIGSGSAMFTAQLWGKKDVPNIRRVLGLCLGLSLLAALIFLLLAEVYPEQVLSIYSEDARVIAEGAAYLRIFGWSFVTFAISFSFSLVLRSVGDVNLPVFVSVAALIANTLLSYGLVFGQFGLPGMGVPGAAVAVVLARAFECGALLTLTYLRGSPAAGTPAQLFALSPAFVARVLKPVLPVMANEFLWSMGITAYNVVYGHIGTDAIAAMNIFGTIDNLALVVFFGITSATAVMVGNRIGEGDDELAFRYAGRSLGLGAAIGVLIGVGVFLSSGWILALYRVSPAVIDDARALVAIASLFYWLRVTNMTLIVGVLRSGGDTRFSLFLDGMIIWILGVPMAVFAAFVLGLPVYWVYLFVMSEEVLKWALGLRRYFSRKWINRLAHAV